MRLIPIFLTLVTLAAATPLEEAILDLDTAIENRLAVATDKTEVKALGQTGAAIKAYIAAAAPDRKARALLPKAAKAITKSRTPDSAIAADGQVAIQVELGAVVLDRRTEAFTKLGRPDLAGTKTFDKMTVLIAKGDAIMATLPTIPDFAKADASANKAIDSYEKAIALADKVPLP
jgi:hypothetical protein